MDDSASNPEVLAGFVDESREGLQAIEQDLLKLEHSGVDPETLNRIFRVIHSVKGASSFLSLVKIEAVSHLAETLLSDLKAGKRPVTTPIINSLLQTVDLLQGMVNSPDLGMGTEIMDVCARLQAHIDGTAEAGPEASADPLLDASQDWSEAGTVQSAQAHSGSGAQANGSQKSAAATATASITPASPGSSAPSTSALPPATSTPAGPAKTQASARTAAPPASGNPARPKPAHGGPGPNAKGVGQGVLGPNAKGVGKAVATEVSSIRLNVKVLDELLELIGEVVLGRNQLLRKYEDDPAFSSLSQRITKLHQHVIQTRMQPIATIFERFSRTVRDLSLKVGKEITLHLEGNELELDRTILEKISDPLTHLVRNAVDHAIEEPDERIQAGKSRMGHIHLRAYQESGQIIFEVEDDGKGLDIDRIRAKGLSAGLITEQAAGSMSDREIIDLIFRPGFSTKDQVSEISGRGVGMDVVKTNLEQIGCAIDMITRKGKGTLFSARMPLTEAIVNSSIIPALIVGLGKHRFAIPQMGVNEIVKLNPREREERVEKVEGRDVFRLRDRLVPLIRLEDVLEIPRPQAEAQAPRNAANAQKGGVLTLVILKFKQDYFGALVDEILGIEEIVVKNLPRLIKTCRVFSGVSMIGDGEVAMILDTNGVVEKARLDFNRRKQGAEEEFWQKKRHKADKQELLLFSNADNELFGIPLNLISLIERIEPGRIERVGTDEFAQIQGSSLPLLRLENHINASPIDPGRRHLFVIKPDRISHPVGILAGRILKSVEMGNDINSGAGRGKGVLGSILHEGRMVMVLDMYALVQSGLPDKLAISTKIDLHGVRILYAEDSPFFQNLFPQYLADTGAKVTIAEDGMEALRVLNASPRGFDVVVSDIEMPNMDGFELVLNIRSNPATKDLPVIALTTLSGEDVRKKGVELGFDFFERKIDKERVLKCLRQSLDDKKQEIAHRVEV